VKVLFVRKTKGKHIFSPACTKENPSEALYIGSYNKSIDSEDMSGMTTMN
jgi:hypothetical protein